VSTSHQPFKEDEAPEPFGVYVHVPFCRHRCDYCAFATWTDRGHLVDRYLDACRRQVAEARDSAEGLPPVTSVFVGGGTPTLVPAAQLLAVLAEVPLAPGAEVSVECNPDDVSPELFQAFHDGGVTRLSIGVQSMVPSVLASLGRTHDPANVERAAEAAHAVGLPFNVDLIYGAAGETFPQWEETLTRALDLDPAHVSAYGLTVEAGTPLAAQPERHPDDDDQADKYLLATERLGAAGFEWYEISNWAKPGRECRHNRLYWTEGEYLAIGCAAHGHRHGRRYWNVRTPDRFVAGIEEGRSVEAGAEELDAAARRVEGLQLALRTAGGVPVEAFDPADLAGPFSGLVEVRHDADGRGHAVLTVPGRLLANEVALRLL
jgi:oxygen-independent coproporphyrinogen-3 oxidase